MYNSFTPGLARAYQAELLREAEQRRRGKLSKRPELRLRERLLVRAGRALISIGSKLVERYGPVLVGGPGACPDATGKALG